MRILHVKRVAKCKIMLLKSDFSYVVVSTQYDNEAVTHMPRFYNKFGDAYMDYAKRIKKHKELYV